MLEDFKDSYSNSAQELQELCQTQNFAKARELAMEIKDFALHIGAYSLGESIASLEYTLEKESHEIAKPLYDSYKENLERVLQEIEEYKQNN